MLNYEARLTTSGGVQVARLRCWIDASRQLRASVSDQTTTRSAVVSAALPTDGLWHKIEATWVANSGVLLISIDDDTASTGSAPLSISWDDGYNLSEACTGGLPVADWCLSRGSGSGDGADFTWAAEGVATVYPSSVFINGPLEPEATEAWAYLTAVAQAEAAQMRIDEDDRFIYAPPGWFALGDRANPSGLVSTDADAQIPTVRVDPTKIRNTVLVRYQARSGRTLLPALEGSDVLEIPGGTSTFRVPLAVLGVVYRGTSLHLATAAEITAGVVASSNWVTLNTASDGTGTVIDSGATATVTDVYGAGAVEVTFVNPYSTLYTANSGAIATMYLAGAVLARDTILSESDDASIVLRGERVVSLTADHGITRAGASRVGRRVVHATKDPMVELDPVAVSGNPARKPGHLVRVVDSDQTGVDGLFRIRAIGHTLGPGQYEQDLHAVSAVPLGRWGDGVSRWGRCRWSARPFGWLADEAQA